MEVRKIKVKDLEQNIGQINGLPANPRQWTKDELESLKASIIETPELMEARGAIVYPLDGKYIVLGGNMRLSAVQSLGWDEMPCIILSEDMPVEKLKEIVVKDNGSFGEWDMDALANEWDDLPLSDWGVDISGAWDDIQPGDDADVKEDDFDEENETIVCMCKPGDVWQCGEHRVMCGNSLSPEDVQKLLGGVKANMLITDPPYNVDYEGGTGDKMKIWNDNMGSSEFFDFLKEAFSIASANMMDGAAFYVWMATVSEVSCAMALKESGLLMKQILIWAKSRFVLGRQDYQWQHEPCLYGWKEGAAHYFRDDRTQSTLIEDAMGVDVDKMKKAELLQCIKELLSGNIQTSVLREQTPVRNDLHPTMKPVPLFGKLIRNSSREGDIVLDAFGGSGTTMIACEQLGRKARLMELDPHYCDVIIARWEKFTGNKAVKIG